MKKKEKQRPVRIFYEMIDTNYRWWLSSNPGDVFDVFQSEAELKARLDGAAALGIRVIAHLPAFCEGCKDCEDYR